MKSTTVPFKIDLKTQRLSPRKFEAVDRRFQIQKKNADRTRIVQSVHAGHVRGGHGFH
jgi:hypothetical protein